MWSMVELEPVVTNGSVSNDIYQVLFVNNDERRGGEKKETHNTPIHIQVKIDSPPASLPNISTIIGPRR